MKPRTRRSITSGVLYGAIAATLVATAFTILTIYYAPEPSGHYAFSAAERPSPLLGGSAADRDLDGPPDSEGGHDPPPGYLDPGPPSPNP